MSAIRRRLGAAWRPGTTEAPAPGAGGAPGVALEARGVTVRLGGRAVLEDVGMQARTGELVCLVGPNGAGKSTLLSALAGDVRPRPAGGEVLLYGRPLPHWSARALARHRAVLPQQHTVSFPFRVAEIVAMGRAPWARSDRAREDDAAVAEALAAAEIEELAERRLPTLSGGEQARVAVARVLAQRTPVLLLDEPTAALDLRHQELVLRRARSHARDGGCVVAVLHDVGLAAAYADRIAVMADGRIVADGAPAEVLTAPLLSSVYHQPVDVVAHPGTGSPLVLPVRDDPYAPSVGDA